MSGERRRGGLTFKVGEDRFRPPPGVDQVVVQFGPVPVRLMLIRRFNAIKVVVTARVIEPQVVAGRTLFAFYNPPRDGTLTAGSNLTADLRRLLVQLPDEGEPVDLQRAFGGRKAVVALRRVGKGAEQYAVLGRILREAL